MELSDLTHEEKVALVALLEMVVAADGAVSGSELAQLDRVIAELGSDTYAALADEVDRRFPSEDELRPFLARLGRPEARELIYGAVLDAAIPGAVEVRESRVLDWLARAWGVTVRVESSGRDE